MTRDYLTDDSIPTHLPLPPLGSLANPLHTSKALSDMEWPVEFKDEPYIYAVPPGGAVTKWYRSYADYCD